MKKYGYTQLLGHVELVSYSIGRVSCESRYCEH